MEQLIHEIVNEHCQNDREYLQNVIDQLQDIYNDEEYWKEEEEVVKMEKMVILENNETKDLVLFKNEIDIEDFERRVNEYWELLEDDYEFDEFYDFIERHWNVESIYFMDNLVKIRY